MNRERVLIGISGGVSSAVAAALLKNQGYDVEGLYLKISPKSWSSSKSKFFSRCSTSHSIDEAQKVCETLGIVCNFVDVSAPFEYEVIDYLIHESLQHRVPNPCVCCTRDIIVKFLAQKTIELGYSWMATGHYARVFQDTITQRPLLLQALDAQRDQSYYLYGLSTNILQKTLTPLGGLLRDQVQKLSFELGIDFKVSEHTMAPCFIEEKSYIDLVEKNTPMQFKSPGTIRTTAGEIVGQHEGLYRHSIGQKPHGKLSTENPDQYYIVGFDILNQALIVGKKELLYQFECRLHNVRWLRAPPGIKMLRCFAKFSPSQPLSSVTVVLYENGDAHLQFKEAQFAMAPGNLVVFYLDGEVLGGGYIEYIGGISS